MSGLRPSEPGPNRYAANAGSVSFWSSGTVKAVENGLERFWRNTWSIVGNGDFDLVSVDRPRANRNGALGTSILNRIIDEVAQHLLEAAGIGPDPHFFDLLNQAHLFGFR